MNLNLPAPGQEPCGDLTISLMVVVVLIDALCTSYILIFTSHSLSHTLYLVMPLFSIVVLLYTPVPGSRNSASLGTNRG